MDAEQIKRIAGEEFSLLQEDLRSLALDLWEHPELAWKEEYSSQKLCSFLTEHGIQTEKGYCGFPTAFRSEVENGPGKTFAFACEYDALKPGHACGHNLIAACSTGAMIAASRIMKKLNLPGRLVILGTPAEESGAGKVHLLKHNILDNIDAVVMAHPGKCTIPDRGSLAIRRYNVTFHGKSSHASGSPELGINALDAVMLLFSAVNSQRQQMPEFCRIHGIVTEGGVAPNIIPDSASCQFFLRSAKEDWMEILDERFDNMVKGVALCTGTEYTKEPLSINCRSRKPNTPLNDAYVEVITELGEEISVTPKEGRGSSDFGDFSQVIPGIHPYFAITEPVNGAHSPEFMEAARSERGVNNMLKAAQALTYTACKYLSDPEFQEKVKADFEENC